MKQDQYILSADEFAVVGQLKKQIDAVLAQYRTLDFGVGVAAAMLTKQNGLEGEWKFSDDFLKLVPVKQDEGKPDPDNEGK